MANEVQAAQGGASQPAAPAQDKEQTAQKPRPRKAKGAEWIEGYQGVGVFLEQHNGRIAPVAWELCGVGRQLADKINGKLYGIICGHDIDDLAQEAIYRGCDEVYVVESPELASYRNWAYTEAILPVIDKIKVTIFLLGATSTGRDLAGTVATRLSTGLTADCTQLDVDPETGLLDAIRPAFLEKQLAVILCKKHRPQMATVRPGVMEAAVRDTSRQGAIIKETFALGEDDIPMRVLAVQDEGAGAVDLTQADVIVAGGRGLGEPRNFELLRELADTMGAVIGASRPVVDAGWIGHEHQVGQTGTTVRPKVYVAVGISGAIQHLVGMQNSDVIIAINRDPAAPIFAAADFGIIGDLFTILPLLTEALREKLGDRSGGPASEAGQGQQPVTGGVALG